MPQRPRSSASTRPGWTGTGRTGRLGRSIRAARARFTKRATFKGALVGRSAGRSGPRDARRDVDADDRRRPQGGPDAGRVEAAGQRDLDLACDGGNEAWGGAGARAPTVRPAPR